MSKTQKTIFIIIAIILVATMVLLPLINVFSVTPISPSDTPILVQPANSKIIFTRNGNDFSFSFNLELNKKLDELLTTTPTSISGNVSLVLDIAYDSAFIPDNKIYTMTGSATNTNFSQSLVVTLKSDKYDGAYPLYLKCSYYATVDGVTDYYEQDFVLIVEQTNHPEPGPSPTVPPNYEGEKVLLNTYMPVGPKGETYGEGYVPTAKGQKVRIYMPLAHNTAFNNPIYGGFIRVTPVIDETFKFVPTNVSKRFLIDNFNPETDYFDFTFKSDTYDGSYPTTFLLNYNYIDNHGVILQGEQKIVVYSQIKNGKVDASATNQSLPRVMLSSYTVNPDKIFAGDTFDLDLYITNENTKLNVQNVKLTVKNEDGTFLPLNGSNSVYFATIKSQETIEQRFTFDTNPAAEAKAHNLTVEIAYDDPNATPLTESSVIAIPVNQAIRIKIDEPQIYAGMMGQPISISMNVYNLGKSVLYNLYAAAEGEGLTLEQGYYGGNIESGGKKTIDLSVIPSPIGSDTERPIPEYQENTEDVQPMFQDGVGFEDSALPVAVVVAEPMPAAEGKFIDGEMDSYIPPQPIDYFGKIIITYEDVLGKTYTETKEFFVTVMPEEQYNPEPMPDIAVDAQADSGFPTWLIFVLGGLIIAALIVFFVVRGKKRRKIIEDELF